MKTILCMLFAFAVDVTAGIKLLRPPAALFYRNVTLQARVGGGLRASYFDFCGMESLYFFWKNNLTGTWSGDQVKSKTGGSWIFEDPFVQLEPGDTIVYSCGVMYQGAYFTKGNPAWIVPGLVDEFEPVEPPKNLEDCSDNKTSPKPDKAISMQENKMTIAGDAAANRPDSKDWPSEIEHQIPEKPVEPGTDSRDRPSVIKPQIPEKPVEPETKDNPKSEKPKNQSRLKPSNNPIFDCEIQQPQSGESYQQKLERQLVKLQCDNMRLAEQSYLDKQAFTFELLEIIKLHEDLGKRIKKLDMLLRP